MVLGVQQPPRQTVEEKHEQINKNTVRLCYGAGTDSDWATSLNGVVRESFLEEVTFKLVSE